MIRIAVDDGRRAATVEAVAQFVALMHAHERGERNKAVEARQALDRLGVKVRFSEGARHAK